MLTDEYNEALAREANRVEDYQASREETLKTSPKISRMIKDKKSDKDIMDELHINKEDLEYYKKLYKAFCEN